MKLEYGTDTLGDDSVGDFILDHGGDHARLVQHEPLAGGGAPFLAGKGNHTNQRSFTVAKEHATPAAAVEWFNLHPEGLEAEGIVRITESSFACQMFAVLATVNRVELTGRSTTLRYNFTGQQTTPAV